MRYEFMFMSTCLLLSSFPIFYTRFLAERGVSKETCLYIYQSQLLSKIYGHDIKGLFFLYKLKHKRTRINSTFVQNSTWNLFVPRGANREKYKIPKVPFFGVL